MWLLSSCLSLEKDKSWLIMILDCHFAILQRNSHQIVWFRIFYVSCKFLYIRGLLKSSQLNEEENGLFGIEKKKKIKKVNEAWECVEYIEFQDECKE